MWPKQLTYTTALLVSNCLSPHSLHPQPLVSSHLPKEHTMSMKIPGCSFHLYRNLSDTRTTGEVTSPIRTGLITSRNQCGRHSSTWLRCTERWKPPNFLPVNRKLKEKLLDSFPSSCHYPLFKNCGASLLEIQLTLEQWGDEGRKSLHG